MNVLKQKNREIHSSGVLYQKRKFYGIIKLGMLTIFVRTHENPESTFLRMLKSTPLKTFKVRF